MGSDAAVGKVQRSVEIVSILYRNEFFSQVRRLATAERRPTGPGKHEVAVPEDIPYKMRRTLEELGPTFIKIGQLLGTRPDLVPAPFVDEFRNLYDKTTPSPFREVKALIEDELGRPLGEVFTHFSEEPVASASIGQVHFARLRSGEKVAVKVQHPGIEQRVWIDFQIMRPLVRFVENLFAASRVWQPSDHLAELAAMLEKELDYRYEAETLQQVHDNFAGDATVKIPRVFWKHSAKRVLTLERIEGIKLSDLDAPEVQALDGKRLARVITHGMAKQIFEHRLFHADPSPGNLMAIDSRTVAFLDYGAVGKVTRRRAQRVMQLITGFMRADLDATSRALMDICNVYGEVDMRSFHRDVEKIMDYYERERASVGDPVVLDMIIQVARQHNMLLPPDFMLITRALFQFEGLCKKLDPNFELVETLQPYIVDYVRREALSFGGGESLLEAALATTHLVKQFPGRVGAIVRKLESNELRLTVDVAGSEDRQAERRRRALHGSFTGLVGAVTVGAAFVVSLGAGNGSLMNYVFFVSVLAILWAFGMLYLHE